MLMTQPIQKLCCKSGLLPLKLAFVIQMYVAADMQTIEDGPRGEELDPDNNPQAPLLFFNNRSI